MNTAKVGRIADKIKDSAQRMQSYAHDAARAADSEEFFGKSNFNNSDKKLINARQRLKAELEELNGLVAELDS